MAKIYSLIKFATIYFLCGIFLYPIISFLFGFSPKFNFPLSFKNLKKQKWNQIIYDNISVISGLFLTAITFILMELLSYKTHQDPTKYASIFSVVFGFLSLFCANMLISLANYIIFLITSIKLPLMSKDKHLIIAHQCIIFFINFLSLATAGLIVYYPRDDEDENIYGGQYEYDSDDNW